ncbi:MAG: putative zinc-binding metallopeptidase [Gammaproteobacteria bacterium]|nr:putative zinc-binding metallopeptidase [Gammaproteobacteria bacterium]
MTGNDLKWARLEAAKRRLIYTLDLLNLPYGTAAEGFTPPLSFDFKGDELPNSGQWRSMGEAEQVFTGHAEGKITINIKEADHVEREQLREQLGESQRTIIGHFRHEIGHYFWDLLVKGDKEPASIELFGDHNNPTYQEALERHYNEGPPPDWQEQYVSAYATMHPWEDFAETFALYLDMASVLDTAGNAGFLHETAPLDDFEGIVSDFQRVGLVMNEMTREMGLVDYTPEVLVEPVLRKLEFIHDLTGEAGNLRGSRPVPK